MGRGCVEGVRSHGLRVGQPEWSLLALPQELPGHDLLRKSTRICPGKSSPGRGEEARKKAERAQTEGVTQVGKGKASRKVPRPGPSPVACRRQLGKRALLAPSPFFQVLKSAHAQVVYLGGWIRLGSIICSETPTRAASFPVTVLPWGLLLRGRAFPTSDQPRMVPRGSGCPHRVFSV